MRARIFFSNVVNAMNIVTQLTLENVYSKMKNLLTALSNVMLGIATFFS